MKPEADPRRSAREAGGEPPPDAPVRGRHGRWPLLLIALVCLAPVVASYLAYYVFQRGARVNYGELIAQPAPALAATTADGAPFSLAAQQGGWVIVATAAGSCDAACASALYATRQARTMQGRDLERVTRVLVLTGDGTPPPALLAQHPDLRVLRAAAHAMDAWPRSDQAIYLVDPIGNLVLAWPREPDIKALSKDLSRILRASQIG